jgi:hypothetical protein
MNMLKKPLKGVGTKMFGSAQSLSSSSKNLDLTQEFEVSEAPNAAPNANSSIVESPPRKQKQRMMQQGRRK